MFAPFRLPFLRIAGMGLLTGARSLSGLALISDKLGRPKSRLVFFRNPKYPGTIKVLKVLAIAEMAGDKFPFAPHRTALGPLLGRVVAGGLVGALMFREFGKGGSSGYWLGAATGSLAAAAGAYAAYGFRHWAGRGRLVPDFLLGLMEDAAVTRLGKKMVADGKR